MESFRQMVRGWLGITILVVIVLVLALAGIETYFAGSQMTAAKVGDMEITQPELERMVERQRQQVLAQMGPEADPSLLDMSRLRQSVLDSLITRALLEQQAREEGYLISDATVHRLIREVPAFQENGQFSQERYVQALQQIGENPANYPARAKQELAYSMLIAGVGQSGFMTTPELQRLSALESQKRDIHYASLPAARYLAGLSASDEEVRRYYEANRDRFATPETVTLEYITLSRDNFLSEAAPTEEDLRVRYEEKVREITANEQRQAQHILITIDDKTSEAEALKRIQEIEKSARAGEDFGKLAKEFSQDPGSVAGGGDLGLVSRGNFVPEFDQVLFSLNQGEISEPVKTQYGYHLIKLNSVEKPSAPSFAALRPELEREVREARADELFSEAVDRLDTAVYEAADLSEPAARFNRSVETVGPLTREGGTGIAAERRVKDVIFSDELIKEGRNSQGLHLPDGRVVWVRVKQYTPAAVQPLAEVMADARNQLLLEKASQRAKAAAEAVTKALAQGASLEGVAKEHNLSWQHLPEATRRSPVPTQEILQVAYRLPQPAEGKVSADSFGVGPSHVVVAVSRVVPGEPAPAEELARMRNVLSENRSQQEFQDYVRFLRERGDVEVFVDTSKSSQE